MIVVVLTIDSHSMIGIATVGMLHNDDQVEHKATDDFGWKREKLRWWNV